MYPERRGDGCGVVFGYVCLPLQLGVGVNFRYGKVSGVGSWTVDAVVIATLWIVNWFYAESFRIDLY